MGIYVGYFLVVKSDTVIDNPYNARATIFEDRVTRGKILADDGTVLAKTVTATDSNGTEVREYPYGSLFAHAVGYSTVGKTGIESLANFDLLRSHTNLIEQTADEIMGRKSIGDNVVTTLNVNLQQIASDALGKNRVQSSPSSRIPERSSAWFQSRPSTRIRWRQTGMIS